MSDVSHIGMVLYLLLAVLGGFLTGLFSRYSYDSLKTELGRTIAAAICGVFYVAPVWAFFSLFKQDDLDIFYLLLIISFVYGCYHYSRFSRPTGKTTQRESYWPDEDDN